MLSSFAPKKRRKFLSHFNHKSRWKAHDVMKESLTHRMNTKFDRRTSSDNVEAAVVWDKPGGLSRIFTSWTWPWSFCPIKDHKTRDTVSVLTESENKDHLTTIDHAPVIRQPPPLTVQTSCPSPHGLPKEVYICNLPKDCPSSIQFVGRVMSTDSLTVSEDEASLDGDVHDHLPSPIQRRAPPRPPRNISTGAKKPLLVTTRDITYGSATTQSSRHRRSFLTVSPKNVKQVYDNFDDSSQDTPFPDLTSEIASSWNDEWSGDSLMVNSPPVFNRLKGRLNPVTTEPTHSESEKWMEVWAAGASGGQAEQPGQETQEEIQEDTSLEIHVSTERVEFTYLPRCPWLEHAFLSAGSKIIFAGWVVYSPNHAPIRNLPLRQDIVYMILLENIPKIYLARDKDQEMSTLDVSPKMRVEMKDVSKSLGRGVIVRQDGIVHGTFLPISLPSYMFKNHSLVDQDEFEDLAYCTMAPFRRDYTPSSHWCQAEYHQEYAPVAQLDAAMHLLFVMDSWMTRMLFR